MKKFFSINLIFFLYILIVAVIFAVTEAKVFIIQGTGEVRSVEPHNKLITVEIDDSIYMLGTYKDTVFKGVKSLQDVKKGDKVSVKYKIDEHGGKFITSLEKKAAN